VHTLNEAVCRCLPDQPHQNNHQLFTLARAVKALEAQHGKFSPDQLRHTFDLWFGKAKPFLREGQSREQYYLEFLNAYARAKFPLGSVIIPKAWKLAKEQPLPPEAMEFENQDLRLLIGFCKQLQINSGSEPFYLSSRSFQALVGHESHSTAAKWLRALCALQILQEVEKGIGFRASRYRYQT
jgi:hypothetical protein